jgi:hypothetical protein
MRTQFCLYSLLATFCAARLQSDPWIQRETLSFPGKTCWEDGAECDPDTTCINCCAGLSYMLDGTNTTACGYGSCLKDGTVCSNATDYNCWQCCNGAYEDGGKVCGGQCLGSGTSCEMDSTCSLCCNYTTVRIEDSYQCGCLEDGQSCIPGDTCYSCCNGAYDDSGSTCGGTCIADETECVPGEDCHLCCTYSTYWYSTGKMQCGMEPCFEDGTSCIPGISCSSCCSGGAYDGDGTVCGGKCLKSGSNCSYFGSCNSCCQHNPEILDGDSIDSNSDAKVSMPYPIGGGMSYWNASVESMVCGYEMCLEDGTDCIPGYTCHKCCNNAFDDNGSKCGGTCLESGSKCNFFSTCSQCCMTSKYNTTLGYHMCTDYDEYIPLLEDDSESNIIESDPED